MISINVSSLLYAKTRHIEILEYFAIIYDFRFTGEIVLYNIFYDVSTLCTSIVAQNSVGKFRRSSNKRLVSTYCRCLNNLMSAPLLSKHYR